MNCFGDTEQIEKANQKMTLHIHRDPILHKISTPNLIEVADKLLKMQFSATFIRVGYFFELEDSKLLLPNNFCEYFPVKNRWKHQLEQSRTYSFF